MELIFSLFGIIPLFFMYISLGIVWWSTLKIIVRKIRKKNIDRWKVLLKYNLFIYFISAFTEESFIHTIPWAVLLISVIILYLFFRKVRPLLFDSSYRHSINAEVSSGLEEQQTVLENCIIEIEEKNPLNLHNVITNRPLSRKKIIAHQLKSGSFRTKLTSIQRDNIQHHTGSLLAIELNSIGYTETEETRKEISAPLRLYDTSSARLDALKSYIQTISGYTKGISYDLPYSTRSEDCHHCEKTGRVICSRCKGQEKFDCGCENGWEVCSDCGATMKIDCPDCNGNGKYKCETCDGEGTQTCILCEGSGREISSTVTKKMCDCKLRDSFIECEACKGKGTDNRGNVCSTCKGKKQICEFCRNTKYYSEETESTQKCRKCNGVGWSECSNRRCDHGIVRCEVCLGNRRIPCNNCSNGYTICSKCEGKTYIICGNCKGKGNVECPVCEGVRKIYYNTYKLFELDDTLNPNNYCIVGCEGDLHGELLHYGEPKFLFEQLKSFQQNIYRFEKNAADPTMKPALLHHKNPAVIKHVNDFFGQVSHYCKQENIIVERVDILPVKYDIIENKNSNEKLIFINNQFFCIIKAKSISKKQKL